MITAEQRAQMRRLVLVEQLPIETVARKFGVHHSTVRRAIQDKPPSEAAVVASALESFKPYIVKRLDELPELTSSRLMLELRDRGYQHSIAILRRYVARVRLPRARKMYLRIETEAGEQAQVDWGSFGHLRVGNTQRPLSVFSMVLSWSRALFIDFSLDQQMETWSRRLMAPRSRVLLEPRRGRDHEGAGVDGAGTATPGAGSSRAGRAACAAGALRCAGPGRGIRGGGGGAHLPV